MERTDDAVRRLGVVDHPSSTPDSVGVEDLLDAHYSLPYDVFLRYRTKFEDEHGKIARIQYSANGPVGVILVVATTRDGEVPDLFYRPPSELSPQFAKALFRADQVMIEAKLSLSSKNLRLCLEMVYSALSYLFRVVDSKPSEGKLTTVSRESFQVVNDQLNSATDYYTRLAARYSVLLYAAGMIVVSFLLLFVLAAAIYYYSSITILPVPTDPVSVVAAIVAGGLGAIVSVMIRMSQGQLVLARDLSRVGIFLIGGFRPLIGVISGALVFVLVVSGWLPVRPLNMGPSTWTFYAGMAFVAGFSERFIQDSIVRTQAQISSRHRASGHADSHE